MLAIAAYDLHMLLDLSDRLTLLASACPPSAELIIEAIAILPLIFGIVTV